MIKDIFIDDNIKSKLDPRSKLFVLITISIFVLGGTYQGIMKYYIIILSAIPFILLIMNGDIRISFYYFVIFNISLTLQIMVIPKTSGILNYFIIAITNLLVRFSPSIAMGYVFVTTTTISEFIAAMEKIHLPKQITIPMAVMCRFFPTIIDQWKATSDAMKIRNITLFKTNFMNYLEYKLVPMIISSIIIGEELSASALTRGLGGPVRRTNICKIGFKSLDIFLIMVSLLPYILLIFQ
ncbi:MULTISPECIES: energy-coupling factor transporter transmembrane component T [Peptoniphilaceae]|uniref:energy-coupling factor transporter transmembrane component T n=1 Tax=Peptoniphilaceae TaxID=1570339 RepID=UPI00242F3D75|nr:MULTISPECIES: energy-coupling factor transporter transmembrane component T [Peptoniphilaceae]MDU5961440.1 energy-coupling factor transporter transmembrane component T [Finegoldia magna]